MYMYSINKIYDSFYHSLNGKLPETMVKKFGSILIPGHLEHQMAKKILHDAGRSFQRKPHHVYWAFSGLKQ